MTSWWRTGHVLLAVGLGWWLADRLLVWAVPGAWGGPNIGGGLLLLLTGAVGLAGLVVVIATAVPVLRSRAVSRRWPLVALNGGLLAALLLARALVSNDDALSGVTGVTVDEQGRPVLVLAVCHGSVDAVTVHGPNDGERPNELLLELRSAEPVTSFAVVGLTDPGPTWTGGIATVLPPPGAELVIASAHGSRYGLAQVAFTADQLAGLEPGTVQRDAYRAEGSSDAPRVPLDGFRAAVCGDDA